MNILSSVFVHTCMCKCAPVCIYFPLVAFITHEELFSYNQNLFPYCSWSTFPRFKVINIIFSVWIFDTSSYDYLHYLHVNFLKWFHSKQESKVPKTDVITKHERKTLLTKNNKSWIKDTVNNDCNCISFIFLLPSSMFCFCLFFNLFRSH